MKLEEMEKKLNEFEARVRHAEDIQEIHQLQRRYFNSLIVTDWDTCIDCFAQDGKIDVYLHDPVEGREQIEKFFREELPITHAGVEGDILAHPEIEVDGDKAKGKWIVYLMYMYPRTGQSLFWVQAYINQEYKRENGKWKVSLMTFTERMGLPGTGPPTGLW